MAKEQNVLEKIVSLCKRRGFIFQSSEIYGGLNGCWDYGPLGVELLRNIKEEWWRSMTYRDDVEGLDASILMHPRVWEASGHVENFTDPMVDCKQCKSRFRLDVLLTELSKKARRKIIQYLAANAGELSAAVPGFGAVTDALAAGLQKAQPGKTLDEIASGGEPALRTFAKALTEGHEDEARDVLEAAALIPPVIERLSAAGLLRCPNCGAEQSFTTPRTFNLMFKTFIGPVEDDGAVVFLRPETAQGIFVDFLSVLQGTRQKVPFGIAQVGKAFRNEINTKNFLFRTREFEQMEMEFFVRPGDDEEWYERWREERFAWFLSLGMNAERLRFAEHPADKLAHYAKKAVDIEYHFPFGWGEIEGIHNRTDYDLRRHQEFSGKSMEYFDADTQDRYIPYVIETSAGASRSLMAFLADAYREEEVKDETRVVMGFHPRLAPYKAAVLPLVNRDGMDDIAHRLFKDLQGELKVFYDDSGSIGRRYRRQDEAGTPYCLTIDSQTLEDQTVTVRERDSMNQERIGMDHAARYLREKLRI